MCKNNILSNNENKENKINKDYTVCDPAGCRLQMQNRFILDYVQNIKYEGYSNPQYHKRSEGISVFVFFFTFLIILGKKVSRFRMSVYLMMDYTSMTLL